MTGQPDAEGADCFSDHLVVCRVTIAQDVKRVDTVLSGSELLRQCVRGTDLE